MSIIGIVGNGFVGNSIATGMFGFVDDVKIYDIDTARSTSTLKETVNESDIVFLSVPTPMRDVLGGEIDLSILHNALQNISDSLDKNNPVIVIKSTIVPGTMEKLQEKFSNLRLVFSPEFLTERYARLDFINSARIVLGGKDQDIEVVEKIMRPRFPGARFIKTDFATAQLIKYMANCFFAVKVSFMNEMRIVADKCGADWDKAVDGFIRDGRIGHSHLNVPGHDGKFGFGGSCFPKDIQALIDFGKTYGINLNTLSGAWQTNLEVRPEKDWEKLLGKAVV